MKYHQWLEHWTCVQSRANAKKTLWKHLTIYALIPISRLCLHPGETFWIFKRAPGANCYLRSPWSQHITIEVYSSLRVSEPYRRLAEANKGAMFGISFSLSAFLGWRTTQILVSQTSNGNGQENRQEQGGVKSELVLITSLREPWQGNSTETTTSSSFLKEIPNPCARKWHR